MTSRYRVEYALKSHRRDEFIEWIKGLLAGPFVLHADVENFDIAYMGQNGTPEESAEKYREEHENTVANECRKRYLEIFSDVEKLIEHTIIMDDLNERDPTRMSVSRLRKLVPSLGKFFTKLPLTEAFLYEDNRRNISKRRLVSPSFNDVRKILNNAQIMALTNSYTQENKQRLKLITFDGDVTLYEDGKSLDQNDLVVPRLIKLLSMDLFVAVVTAAGYPGQSGAVKYYERLKGLIDHLNSEDCKLTPQQRENLLVMGAESNYLFRYSNEMKGLQFIENEEWLLPRMRDWDKDKIKFIMDTVCDHLHHLRNKFQLQNTTTIIKKERSVGIIPNEGCRIFREQLEEMVLSCSNKLSLILRGSQNFANSQEALCSSDIQVCAFNGGRDVWVDIGDKSLGVESLQKYLCHSSNESCPIEKAESLHVGDQFASVGANDFKARLSACTAWISSPRETVEILDDLIMLLTKQNN
ncbi:IMP-specific 5'-nucleotidase 1 [Spathaspora passalidarum NRRL Y-27907]|uniref:IMP-specific 5'-nucleotidase 1 n=1 Tax=Spathaspora passalidarum (strain NRRL Y-27907 / 11-Y1) TaxID=619300 RepID=G3AGZ7_SPAPN|nr:IMP-specific 5'-nucleotidase 1 [Spathaspora passalidarum NRRL Y-27907]EGW34670.1 IMP-specific 5'-nucleotidase 1 [Spathaspora passalidarum NRRL Y-27907]